MKLARVMVIKEKQKLEFEAKQGTLSPEKKARLLEVTRIYSTLKNKELSLTEVMQLSSLESLDVDLMKTSLKVKEVE